MKFDTHHLLSSKYAKWMILALLFFFSSLILFEYSTLFFSFDNTSPLPNTDNLKNNSKENSPNAILHAALFGVYVPNDVDETQVKKSMLEATVAGILLSDDTKESIVILRFTHGEESTYKLNDKIPGGAIIKRITINGILVEQNGILESLSFPKNELIFEPVAKPLEK